MNFKDLVTETEVEEAIDSLKQDFLTIAKTDCDDSELDDIRVQLKEAGERLQGLRFDFSDFDF